MAWLLVFAGHESADLFQSIVVTVLEDGVSSQSTSPMVLAKDTATTEKVVFKICVDP